MQPTLLGVPNVSEGSDAATIAAIAAAIEAPAAGDGPPRLLDVHSDPDHGRSVLTFAGPAASVTDAMLACAAETVKRIDLHGAGPRGQHPHVGALDVAPVVYLSEADRGAACAQALLLGDRLGAELEIPVFLYGELTSRAAAVPGRSRAYLRRGGLAELTRRMALPASDEEALRANFGPSRPHPSAGVTLVAARPPLVAFNLQLAPGATLAEARRIAGLIREGGAEGLPGVRAIGIELEGGVAQVSMNVERPLEVSLAEVVAAVSRHGRLLSAELVGLAPRAALEGFPADLPMQGFDPARHVIENALGS
jgi:glutamate formiminotransferase / 5-formyltetrahydrofolate cyclo-ligase